METMDTLKDDIAQQLVCIEDRCKNKWGMRGVDSVSLLVRDRRNNDMSIWLSNDPDVHPLVWRPGDERPNPDAGWVLAVFHVNTEFPPPDYYAVATFNHVEGVWQSRIASPRGDSFTVVKWTYLPSIE